MWEYFTEDELRCKCGCGEVKMDPVFMDKLEELRKAVGVPFIVTSGYRCPEYNAKISSTGLGGPHTTGKAVDIAANSKLKFNIVEALFRETDILRLGVAKTFIHIDDLDAGDGFPESVLWTY